MTSCNCHPLKEIPTHRLLCCAVLLQDMADQCAALNKQKVQLQREFNAFKDLTAQVKGALGGGLKSQKAFS